MRDIADDYRQRIYKENPKIILGSIHTEYLAINEESVQSSSLPYILDDADIGLVIYLYDYVVIYKDDSSFFALFMTKDGKAEDYIEIDGWRLSFPRPQTGLYRTYSRYAYISKGNLRIGIEVSKYHVANEVQRLWNLFAIARTCNTQLELNFLKKMYEKDSDIKYLQGKNLILENNIEFLHEQINAYKNLLSKIEELVNRDKNIQIYENNENNNS